MALLECSMLTMFQQKMERELFILLLHLEKRTLRFSREQEFLLLSRWTLNVNLQKKLQIMQDAL